MKKQLFMLPAFLLLTGAVMAQINIGLKGGLNYAFPSTKFEHEDDADYEDPTGLGFHGGAYLSLGISDNFSLRPELLYSVRGLKSTGSSEVTVLGITTRNEWTSKANYNYLEIPVLANLGLGDNLEIHLGPSINMLMGGNQKTETKTTVAGTTTTTSTDVSGSDAIDGMRSIDIGLAAGLAIQMESGFNLGLRFQRGLTSINEDTEHFTQNWNLIQFSVGYRVTGN